MIKPILIWPDTRLHSKSVAVPVLAVAAVKDLVQDMWDTLYHVNGLGLAAIQVGTALRVSIMDVSRQYVFVNPVIVSLDGVKEPKNESCLSLPGVVEQVLRFDAVHLSYLNLEGMPQTGVFTGLEAQCIQHEVDHLDGIMLPDKVGLVERERIRKKMKERK